MTIALLFAIALLLFAIVGGLKEACDELHRIRLAAECTAANSITGLVYVRRLHTLASSAAAERAL